MTARSWRASWASRIFVVVIVSVTVLGAALTALLVWDAQRATRAEAERVTRAVAATLAQSPAVEEALSGSDPAVDAQLLAAEVMADAGVDFVTIMTPVGIRVAHRDPAEIGRRYLGTIPDRPEALTEEFTGTLGPSLRTIEPVQVDGRLVGWVAVGVTVGSISSALVPRLPFVLAVAVAVLVVGIAAAVIARRGTRRVAGDLPAGAVRDTLASHESMRTLGEALRAQTHEHGNRMHTAIALLELGRTPEAIELLSETSRQSQQLVDQVTARRDGDPTVAALLLGKASQAAERGIRWSADIAPDAPQSVLDPIDQVALVGNLIDNALDAAAEAAPPRWVRISMARTGDAELALTVADSGHGVPEPLRDRIFERGFSTKPADVEGRGVGLALVRSVVTVAGGTVAVSAEAPTTFRIVLPAKAAR